MRPYPRDAIPSPPDPTPLELQQIAAGDQAAIRSLIERWDTPISIIAGGSASRSSDLDDLRQAGRLAVYGAALNYRASYGKPFAHYAKRGIKNNVMQEAARLARQRQGETPLADDFLKGEEVPPAFLLADEQADPVKVWVKDLPEPHATIFRLLYIQQLKQGDAAGQMQLSQPRVSQLHQDFLELAYAALS